MLLPLAVATGMLGMGLVRRTPVQAFFRIVYVLLFLVGLELMRNGVTAILRG